ncbi:Endogenous retrovirus group K member 8 Rec protein [Manis javanica]|nr:Endogenous retrovirus group K member 8 Rec protein [Manis javanica]
MPPPSRRRTAHATKESDPPTWGQIKRLSEEAERTVHHQGLPITSILNPFHCYACNHYLSVIVLLLKNSIRKVAAELHTFQLKNKKGGDVGSQSEPPA